jgi:putative restriction endonuclease
VTDLSNRLDPLEPAHRQALLWFWERRGQEITWPEPLDGLFLVNRAKGIHKPKGWRHVLSVRETLSGPYADREPVERPDGSWRYDYFQEGDQLARRDKDFTNRALTACSEEGVPVAVLRQTRTSPVSRYKILGLATVGAWNSGYFPLQGFAPTGELQAAVAVIVSEGEGDSATPVSFEDARRRIAASIVLRQGGAAFRASLIKAYGGRCAITDCDAIDALEAAHIVPYRGPQTDAVENGLLLRADLHTLFDRELIDIDPMSLRVLLSAALAKTAYAALEGRPLRIPQGVKIGDLCKMLQARRELLSAGKLREAVPA